ncbi:MAG: anaerobic ribonucleoside-triphosphate reductase activating protein [Candidatus Gastranaerophilales bacterium]|nr:anaerobic ribonucleoside-triphosphate reductase activating protein [Candidatus Gastranaerophilales bacterium]
MQINGLQKSSLIDYPSKIAAVVFTQGCNFRCGYCHNPALVQPNKLELKNEKEILEFLKSRVNKIDGVVISGGEPTLQKDLPAFVKKVKEMGFAVKLDTNGTNPNMAEKLLEQQFIDYIAMDIKAPIEKYSLITNTKVNEVNILRSIGLVKQLADNGEFRTTVVKSRLGFDDFEKIGEMIEGASNYYLQKFLPDITLDPSFINETTYSDAEFITIKNNMKQYVKNVVIRG